MYNYAKWHTTYFLAVIMSSTPTGASPKSNPNKAVNYFNHFPKGFMVPYGKPKELTDSKILDTLTTWNCEWLMRPKIAMSEMADTFNSCNQVLQELNGEIDVNAIINHFKEVNNAVKIFNTKETKDDKPTVDELVEACVLILDQGTEIEAMVEKMEQFGQAMYLMANHMRVSQTLLNNPEVFASKSVWV